MPLEKSVWVNGNTKSIFRFLPAIVQSATKMALQIHWASVNRHPGYWQRLTIEWSCMGTLPFALRTKDWNVKFGGFWTQN